MVAVSWQSGYAGIKENRKLRATLSARSVLLSENTAQVTAAANSDRLCESVLPIRVSPLQRVTQHH